MTNFNIMLVSKIVVFFTILLLIRTYFVSNNIEKSKVLFLRYKFLTPVNPRKEEIKNTGHPVKQDLHQSLRFSKMRKQKKKGSTR